MKHLYHILSAILLTSAAIVAQPARAQEEQAQDDCWRINRIDHLFYNINICDEYAHIIKRQKKTQNYYTEAFVIPKTVKYTIPSMNTGSGSIGSGDHYFPITELMDSCFYNATSSSITFEAESNVKIIHSYAFHNVFNVTGTLELPSSVETIEDNAIYANYTAIVIPASVKYIGVSSIVLDKATTVIFLGTTPPEIGIDGDYTPWNSDKSATSKEITVQVPEGSFDTYKNTDGIGDYFTCFGREKDSTSLKETTAGGRKGIYSLTGVYLGEDDSQLPRGIYIINGKKVVK